MQHDLRLRTAACAIHDNVYPAVDPVSFSFEEAERFGTGEYWQAVDAAHGAGWLWLISKTSSVSPQFSNEQRCEWDGRPGALDARPC